MVLALAILLAVAYGNHFPNGFHFDDSHSIVDNPAVRSLRNVPRFFTDATTFSILPSNQSFRPVLQTTLAVDYRLAGGYTPWVFQATTFAWFIAQLACMYWLFVTVLRRAHVDHARAIAFLATALYGLHPVGAETVNYVIQRGEILSTVGVVAGLALYAARPQWRRWGLYLVPVAVGALAKPPALVFPLLLFAYVHLFESEPRRRIAAVWFAARAAVPSLVVAALLAWWMRQETPPTYSTGGGDASAYWLTQSWVALRYFVHAFVPLGLSADHDWTLLAFGDRRVRIGLLFVAVLAWTIWRTGRRPSTSPIAFGLTWFVVALLPTSLVPLAEVANDHRLFFPLVGLMFAAAHGASLLYERLANRPHREAIAAAVVAGVLVAGAAGVHARNAVWRTDETLWADVVTKSPRNGRGHMNYGVALMARGNYQGALDAFIRALQWSPNYNLLHLNLGVAYGELGRDSEAEGSFGKGLSLAPGDWRGAHFYGRWLARRQRYREAIPMLERAAALNPADPASTSILDQTRVQAGAEYTRRSLAAFQASSFHECVAIAAEGVRLAPATATLHNNRAACSNGLDQGEAGIAAAREALRLQPDFPTAAANLAWALQQQQKK